MEKFLTTLKENKSFFGILFLIIVIKSSVFDWNYVPTSSMRPTLSDGDQIFINKLAYDVTVPLTHISLYKISDPERGDVVVFDTDKQDVRMVKRIVGVPGDKISLKDNILYLNGKALEYKEYNNSSIEETFKPLDQADKENYEEDHVSTEKMTVTYKEEDLLGIKHPIRLEKGVQKINDVEINAFDLRELTIPEGTYFMMGDNRNNSYDSRFWGLVDRDEIVGKVKKVIFSLDQTKYLKPRSERVMIDVK